MMHDIDKWNDWTDDIGGASAEPLTNWHDPQHYKLVIDVNGGLTASQYAGPDSDPLTGDPSEGLQMDDHGVGPHDFGW